MPSSCMNRSAVMAPVWPSRLRTGASVAWLSDGSCTDQVASASAAIMARLSSAMPATSRKRRFSKAPSRPEREAMPSRLRSIIDIALTRSTQHRNEAVQRLGGDCIVLHHGDADIVGAGIAAVVLLSGQITAGHPAQAGFAPKLQGRRLAAALRRNVEPEKKSAGRAFVAVAVTDDLVGEIEFLAVEAPVLLDVLLVVIGGDGDMLHRRRHHGRGDVAQFEIGLHERAVAGGEAD